jgi:HEAT repeat protein
MSILHPLLLGVVMLLPATDKLTPPPTDPARLKEVLYDRQHPLNQSSAALLLVQLHSADSEEIVRQGLKQTDYPEVFLALAAALRSVRDNSFADELVSALGSSQASIRQSAAETLGELADSGIILRIQSILENSKSEAVAKQAAIVALGRTGQKLAVPVLLVMLSTPDDILRRSTADALAELTGQPYGLDIVRWQSWWERHKDLPEDRWLAERLAYQASRTHRLEGELERARAQIVNLQQQLYARLPPGDRLSHVQSLVEADDPLVRVLAVGWSAELLAGADAVGQRTLAVILMRYSRDGNTDVQRAAVLALGRVSQPHVYDQLRDLLQHGPAPVRAAAARALAQQAKGTGPEALARQRQTVPALQKALDDPELEVVVEAAESLGTLGVPEAGAVLTVLLRHQSQPVRQTAALALERIADMSSLNGLLAALDDPTPQIRFSLVAAVGHAVGDAHTLAESQRSEVLARLEGVMARDADPGVRSRAATVLGECGSVAILPALWKRVLGTEDARVQEKAWGAIIEIIVRSGNPDLVVEWDRVIVATGQAQRRLQFLTEIVSRWQKGGVLKPSMSSVLETLVQVQLEQGKWQAALPVIRDLLSHAATNAALDQGLQWLVAAGQQALKEGKRADVLHIIEEAQPYLMRRPDAAAEFEKLEKAAK